MVSYGYDRDNAEKVLEIMKYQQGHAIFCKPPYTNYNPPIALLLFVRVCWY